MTAAVKRIAEKPDRRSIITKLVLVLFFALGLVVAGMGISGLKKNDATGFSSEAGYAAIHDLSVHMDRVWKELLNPLLAGLSEEERARLNDCAHTLLAAVWEEQKSGSMAEVDALLDSAGQEREKLLFRLLYATYLIDGPKVSTANRKEIAAVPENQMAGLLLPR